MEMDEVKHAMAKRTKNMKEKIDPSGICANTAGRVMKTRPGKPQYYRRFDPAR